MFKYETNLVECFLQLRGSDKNYIRECPFRWGNVDVVEYETTAINYLNNLQIKSLKNKENLLIFSLLYKRRAHTLNYISKELNLSEEILLKKIIILEKLNIVKAKGNLYTINPNIDFPDVIVRSYEMKLNDLKKAINQAVINKKFSDYSYVVMPKEKYKLCMSYKEVFQNSSIGLLLVDDKRIVEVIRAKKIKENNYSKLVSKIRIMNEIEEPINVLQ